MAQEPKPAPTGEVLLTAEQCTTEFEMQLFLRSPPGRVHRIREHAKSMKADTDVMVKIKEELTEAADKAAAALEHLGNRFADEELTYWINQGEKLLLEHDFQLALQLVGQIEKDPRIVTRRVGTQNSARNRNEKRLKAVAHAHELYRKHLELGTPERAIRKRIAGAMKVTHKTVGQYLRESDPKA